MSTAEVAAARSPTTCVWNSSIFCSSMLGAVADMCCLLPVVVSVRSVMGQLDAQGPRPGEQGAAGVVEGARAVVLAAVARERPGRDDVRLADAQRRVDPRGETCQHEGP